METTTSTPTGDQPGSQSGGRPGSPPPTPFEDVVREHGPTVLRVCRAVLGRVAPHEVDDAWSETFVAALRAYPALPVDADVRAWLVTIAHRKAIDVTRARTRRPVPLPDLPERGVHDEQPVEQSELWQAVAALPTKQRLTLAYHFVGGLAYPQVAELVGGTPAAPCRRPRLRRDLDPDVAPSAAPDPGLSRADHPKEGS